MSHSKEADISMSFSDFLEWTNCQLKHYLMVRGKSTTGNKRDLAARALVAFENNEPIVQSAEDLAKGLEREYQALLGKFNIPDPEQIPQNLWTSDVSLWPCVNIGQIFQYILDTKAFETDYVGQYKARKAYSYFKSGHVQQIFQSMVSDDLILFKTKVIPSMRIREQPKAVWVLFSEVNGIQAAHCSCTAGFSKSCNHVIAVLYKLNFASEKGFNKPSCTEISCKFNDRSKYEVEPKKVKDLPIAKHDILNREPKYQIMNEGKANFDPRIRVKNEDENARVSKFLGHMRKFAPDAAVLLNFAVEEGNDYPLPITEIAEAVKQQEGLSEQAMLETFMSKLSFNDSQLNELEKATKGQASNKIWKEQRRGRITASNFHDVSTKVQAIMASRGATKPATTPLLVKLTQDINLDHVDAIKWGRKNEEKASESFFHTVAAKHIAPKLHMCGLRVLKSAPFLAASADNLFSCVCCERACVEYKCPYSIRNHPVSDKWEDLKFLDKVDGEITLKKSHKYYAQVQGQMVANDCRKSYFVVWTTVGKPLILEIAFDKIFWDKLYNDLILFFKLYVAKVLLGLKEILFCAGCDKYILHQYEMNPRDWQSHGARSCTSCKIWFHQSCCEEFTCPTTWVCKDCQ